MARVVWSRHALANLSLIHAYIRQFDPGAAENFSHKLIAAGESLADFADRGRPCGSGKRELATVAPYVIRYRVGRAMVYILGIKHSRQRP